MYRNCYSILTLHQKTFIRPKATVYSLAKTRDVHKIMLACTASSKLAGCRRAPMLGTIDVGHLPVRDLKVVASRCHLLIRPM